jgi:SAM-dependent methyltransferase
MSELMARCPACDSPVDTQPRLRGSDRLHGLPGPFDVIVCGACGTGRTLPFVDTNDLGTLYPGSYNAYALPENRLARAAATGLFRWRYWQALRRLPLGALAEQPPGRLLDVGSGRGDLGLVLSERGWQVAGLEPSPDACAEARSRGVQTECGTLGQTAERLGGDFDAVVFQHSLEHVAEPADDLALARRLLRPGGLLIVSLPNFASTQARRFGTDWFHLDLPRHRTHFTPRGLERLLDRSGFAVESVSTSSSADGLPMSLRYRRYGDSPPSSGAGRYLTVAAVLAAAPLGAAVDRAAGAGDLLHAVARRPSTG